MKNFSELVIRYRTFVTAVIFVATLFWAFQMKDLTINTDFGALLPQTHPYIKIHNEFSKLFGGANIVVMVLEVKEGTIYNQATLEKVKYLSKELRKVPGIDRYKINSIAESKMKDTKITTWGFEATALMWPDVPRTDEEMKQMRYAIWGNPRFYGLFVSRDNKKTLIQAGFFEESLDYSVVYRELNKLRDAVEDDNHILSIVGYPMELGTVRHMVDNVNYILAGTALVIPVLLFLAYRSVWAMIMVPATGVISGIWGLGFMGLMGYNLDPLIFVMPFLIALMAFRHSHQLYNRFYEEYLHHGDKFQGAKTVVEQMFLPGLTSVITDAFGIAIIAIVPIPLLRDVAVACSFWSIITVFIGLILTPILLTYIPVSQRFMEHVKKERMQDEQRKGAANRFADWLGPWLITRRGRATVIVVVLCVLGFSYYWSERLIVGEAQVGSNYLYPASRYNQDCVRINKTHPIINPLYIIVSGNGRWDLNAVPVIKDIYAFSRYMQKNSGAVGTQTLVEAILGVARSMHGNDPHWYGFPDTDREILEIFQFIKTGGAPGDTDQYIDNYDQYTNILVLFKDKRGPTIKRAIATAKEFISTRSHMPEQVTYKLAGGVIGVEAAINEVVAEKQLQTLIIALVGVFVFCSINFRSFKAGLALMIPLALSNFMAFAYMAINHIGLSISTLPVSAAGIGMGVDYGIYLVARLQEEYGRNHDATVEQALNRTIQTYGKSIIYIAGTLVIGLLVWVLSPLKFQAQMGMMLAVILFLNCLGAVFLVPVLVLVLRPKFLSLREK